MQCREAKWDDKDGVWAAKGDMEEDYAADYYWVLLVALAFALGLPALFMHLVYKFKHMGQAGDKKVQNALGWMCA